MSLSQSKVAPAASLQVFPTDLHLPQAENAEEETRGTVERQISSVPYLTQSARGLASMAAGEELAGRTYWRASSFSNW